MAGQPAADLEASINLRTLSPSLPPVIAQVAGPWW